MNRKLIEIQELRSDYELKKRKMKESCADEDDSYLKNEMDMLQAEYGPRLTKKFREIFSEQFLDLPQNGDSGYWRRSNFDGNHSLTDKGMNAAYDRLRVRRSEIEELRSKKYTIWIGLFGAIAGLIAVATPVLTKLIDALL